MNFFQAFGMAEDQFQRYVANGIINWGEPVRSVLEDGDLLISQAKGGDTGGLVTALLAGARILFLCRSGGTYISALSSFTHCCPM